MIKEKLFKNSLLLFDLSNPIFFDKNVLQENYLNLRRHLDTNSDINSEGTFKACLSFLWWHEKYDATEKYYLLQSSTKQFISKFRWDQLEFKNIFISGFRKVSSLENGNTLRQWVSNKNSFEYFCLSNLVVGPTLTIGAATDC